LDTGTKKIKITS